MHWERFDRQAFFSVIVSGLQLDTGVLADVCRSLLDGDHAFYKAKEKMFAKAI